MNSIKEELTGAKTVAITGHLRPDGDCVGSTLGLYNYIKENMPEIDVDIYLDNFEECFNFLKNTDNVKHSIGTGIIYDVFIVLDCGVVDRTADFIRETITNAKKTICIDHHVTNSSFADVNHVFPKISSACEVLYELLSDDLISKNTAECLYTGMVHDTGVFKYQSTTSRTMEIAGKLMDKNIDFTSIIDDTFFRKSYTQNLLLGKALMESKLILDGRLIYSVMEDSTIKEYGVSGKELGGIIDQLRFTQGVEVAMFLYELPEKKIKGSLRSVKYVDVNAIANVFGGGGHIRAAGFTVEGMSFDEVVSKISELVSKQL